MEMVSLGCGLIGSEEKRHLFLIYLSSLLPALLSQLTGDQIQFKQLILLFSSNNDPLQR